MACAGTRLGWIRSVENFAQHNDRLPVAIRLRARQHGKCRIMAAAGLDGSSAVINWVAPSSKPFARVCRHGNCCMISWRILYMLFERLSIVNTCRRIRHVLASTVDPLHR